MADALSHVKALFARQSSKSPIYNFLFPDLTIDSADENAVMASFILAAQHVNSRGTIHGAVSAALVDLMGGLAIAASTRADSTGASVDIHVTYQRTARLGDAMRVVGRVSKLGRNLAFTTVEIDKRVDDAYVVVASGTHTKFLA